MAERMSNVTIFITLSSFVALKACARTPICVRSSGTASAVLSVRFNPRRKRSSHLFVARERFLHPVKRAATVPGRLNKSAVKPKLSTCPCSSSISDGQSL